MHFRNTFDVRIRGPIQILKDVWSGVPSTDRRRSSFPCLRRRNYNTTTIPLMFHGDGAPCTNNVSLEVLSWESITAKMGPGGTTNSIDYICYITGMFSQAFVSQDDSDKPGFVGKTKAYLWTPTLPGKQ